MATVRFTLTQDDITPTVRAMLAAGRDPTPILLAMGTTFKSITEGNFSSAGAQYRPAAWQAKRDGTPSSLRLSGLLWKSFHLTVTKDKATLANPTPYAAIHQVGGIIKAKGKAMVFPGAAGGLVFAKQVRIPARPFYPVKDGQLTAQASEKIAAAGRRVIARLAGQSPTV